jgi:hypothetical protein
MLTGPIIRAMMMAVNTSETSVIFYETTRCNIPQDLSSSEQLSYLTEMELA